MSEERHRHGSLSRGAAFVSLRLRRMAGRLARQVDAQEGAVRNASEALSELEEQSPQPEGPQPVQPAPERIA